MQQLAVDSAYGQVECCATCGTDRAAQAGPPAATTNFCGALAGAPRAPRGWPGRGRARGCRAPGHGTSPKPPQVLHILPLPPLPTSKFPILAVQCSGHTLLQSCARDRDVALVNPVLPVAAGSLYPAYQHHSSSNNHLSRLRRRRPPHPGNLSRCGLSPLHPLRPGLMMAYTILAEQSFLATYLSKCHDLRYAQCAATTGTQMAQLWLCFVCSALMPCHSWLKDSCVM